MSGIELVPAPGAAALAVGTTAGTVAAGDDPRFATAAWVNLTLAAGWSAYGGVQVPRYRKVGDTVQVEGTAQNTSGGTTGAAVGVLPVGFRPAAVQLGRYPASVSFYTDGTMYPNSPVLTDGLLSLSDSFSTL